MSGVIVVVPIRALAGGKTRLASVLSVEARAALTEAMLRRVVAAARTSETVTRVAVVSPDPAALALAAALGSGVVPLQQEEPPGLNPAIELGVRWAVRQDAAAVLVLFADLPLLTGDDVRNLLRRDAPVVVAADRHGTGTNALLLRLGAGFDDATAFRFQFGRDSYARHVDEAHRLGLDVATSLASGTAFDLDTPDDLARVSRDVTLVGAVGDSAAASLDHRIVVESPRQP